MNTSRRDLFTKMTLAGSTAFASEASAEAARGNSDDVVYRCQLPGSVGRALTSRLSERVSVLDFGARGDGTTDDTAAFRNAAKAAADAGKALFVPATRQGYVVTDTIEIRVRRLYGESNFLDSANPGTFIVFKPRVETDMTPCFAIVGGMYGAGLVEDISVNGIENYTLSDSAQWIDPKLLPDYAAFSAGPCGFAVFGNNQPTFRNVSTRGVKVGLYLDSTDGHVSSYDCVWNGLLGVYCHRNSEDYFFLGGGITGVFAGIIFGTFNYANHAGGMNVTMYRVHMGFSPYGFYQVKDAEFRGQAASLYGRLDAVRFEQIGEAIFQFLPDSMTDALMVDNFNFSWSPIYRGATRPNAWLTNLPPEILAYDDQQKFALRMGTLTGDVKLGWLGGAWPLSRSPNAKKSGGLAHLERLDLKDSANLSALGSDYVVRNAATPKSWTRRRGGAPATKMDLALDTDVTPAINLLRNPEELSNWIQRSARVQELSIVPLIDAGGPVPLTLIEELGTAPVVLKIVPQKTGGSHLSLPFEIENRKIAGRSVFLTMWIFGSRVRVRFELADHSFLYDDTYEARTSWVKVLGVDQTSGDLAPRELQIFSEEATPYYICGVMACLDGPKPYTPLNVPRLRHGLALEDVKTSATISANGSSASPAGYLTIKINGVDRQIAYF